MAGPDPPRLAGAFAPEARARYGQAFDAFVAETMRTPDDGLDVRWLCRAHRLATGGGVLRRGHVWLGSLRLRHPRSVPRKVDEALAALRSRDEPACLAAMRLYARLVAIHPFPDGNGRTSRLLAGALLARGGFRSTLFTAVEQHGRIDTYGYLGAVPALVRGNIDEDTCVGVLLRAAVEASRLAALAREREERLFEVCRLYDIADRTLLAFETGLPVTHRVARILGDVAEPWHVFTARLTQVDAEELAFQLERLQEEERSKNLEPVSQRVLIQRHSHHVRLPRRHQRKVGRRQVLAVAT